MKEGGKMAKARLKPEKVQIGPRSMQRTPTIKLVENNRQVSSQSALDRYWRHKGFTDLTDRIVPNAARAEKLEAVINFEQTIEQFSLYGFGYGNWVTQEDRFNYQTAFYFSAKHLQQVLVFPKENIGLFRSLSVTFGARGVPKALAHYEPANDLINLSRYDRGDEDKSMRFMYTGGMGSFAHEYGHFLDYWFGKFVDRKAGESSLSDGNSIAGEKFQVKYTKANPLRLAMAELMQAVIFKNPQKGILTAYYKRLKDNYGDIGGGYFLRHNEIFARLFEVYIFHELKALKIKNAFLTKTKYVREVYIDEADYTRLKPKIDALIKLMRLHLRDLTKR